MERVKRVNVSGFHTIEDARKDARAFMRISGVVDDGGQREDGSYGYSGSLRVEDNHKSITGDFHCGRCGGSGQFVTSMENGKLKGPGGICFRCHGKGFHNMKDRKRNEYHDTHFLLSRDYTR